MKHFVGFLMLLGCFSSVAMAAGQDRCTGLVLSREAAEYGSDAEVLKMTLENTSAEKIALWNGDEKLAETETNDAGEMVFVFELNNNEILLRLVGEHLPGQSLRNGVRDPDYLSVTGTIESRGHIVSSLTGILECQ